MSAVEVSRPRPGVEEWTNEANGFRVVQVRYTADPEKRDPAWKAAKLRDMHPRAFRREYEIDWASPEGDPVVPEFSEGKHVRGLRFDPSLRLLRFWDFGFDSPVVLFAQLAAWDQLRVFRELCPFNVTLRQLIPAAEAVAKNLLGPDAYLAGERAIDSTTFEAEDGSDYRFRTGLVPETPAEPARRVFDAGDPEGYSRKSLGVEAQVMAQFGLRLHVSRPGTEESYQSLRARFERNIYVPGQGDEPAILIDPKCIWLRKALGGAFCKGTLPPYRPKKTHPHKDLVDALRYGNDNLAAATGQTDQKLRELAMRDVVETRA